MKSAVQSRKIILIDDESSVLQALSLLLNALGHDAITFDQPEQAIEFFQSDEIIKYDVIISDLRMPKYDGLALLSKRNEHCPQTPFILISGHATADDIEKATSNGAQGFLSKPFKPDQLAELFSEVLSEY